MMMHGGVLGHRHRRRADPVVSGAPMHPAPIRQLHQQEQAGQQRAEGAQDGVVNRTNHGHKDRT